ncbi:unnamed protein product [Toxocara canis]|uniref:Uncharacterized protein n=1 Tax=Toxocara canis TaxID=6265 RepID=A0A183UIM3_TOXCA|nr:unnamed protein product [Toxocara canis]
MQVNQGIYKTSQAASNTAARSARRASCLGMLWDLSAIELKKPHIGMLLLWLRSVSACTHALCQRCGQKGEGVGCGQATQMGMSPKVASWMQDGELILPRLAS